ncbi:MAG: hypothetical protein JWQ59_458, partial [Cryobacterium sp.]|nr:hypothetical protein [Cryobacterium sp.]
DAYDLLVQTAVDKDIALSLWATQLVQDASRSPRTSTDS